MSLGLEDGALVGNAGGLARQDELLELGFVLFPMGEKHAWSAWHGHDVGVGGYVVGCEAVVVAVGVVVVNEGHGVPAVRGVLGWAVAVQTIPLAAADRVFDVIFQREVERRALYLSIYLGAV